MPEQMALAPRPVFRTLPVMPGQTRVLPQGTRVFELIHPRFSTTCAREEELGRFPAGVRAAERERFLDWQDRVMTDLWKRAVLDAAGQHEAFFVIIGGTNGREKEIVDFARRQFGRMSQRFVFIEAADDIGRAGARMAGRIRYGVSEIRAFGEYTARCVVDLAASLARAMQAGMEGVVIDRGRSVDAGNPALGDSLAGLMGDPASPVEQGRIRLVPADQRAALLEIAEKDFEQRFVIKNDQVLHAGENVVGRN